MSRAAAALAVLLGWGVLSLWIDERWPWAIVQIGIFALASWRMLSRRRMGLTPAAVPLAAAALWPLAQLAFATTIYRQATVSAALDWAAFALIFVLARDWLAAPAARRCFLGAAATFGLAVATVAILGNYLCPGMIGCMVRTAYANDVMGPFVNRNQYCAWVELLLPASLWLAAMGRLRGLFAAAAAVLAASVVASGSRAGMVLAAAEIVAVVLALAFRDRAMRRTLAVRALQFAALATVAIALVGWQEAAARWRHSGPEAVRQDALRASLEMVKAKPLMGSGLGTWSRVYPRYASIDQGVFVNQAHNDWAQWAAEGGLPFFLCIFFFAALLCKPAIQSIYGIGMVAVLLHALVDYPMQQRPALAACFFCLAGAAAAWRGGEDCRP